MQGKAFSIAASLGLLALACGPRTVGTGGDGAAVAGREALPPSLPQGGFGGSASGSVSTGSAGSGMATLGGHSGAPGLGGEAGSAPLAPVPGHGPGAFFEIALEARERPVQSARFSLYVPDGIAKLTGVIVHQHGCGRDGLTVPHDLHWQALANRWGMALMGTQFVTIFPDGDHCDRWAHIENGSGDLLVAALERFATETGQSELSQLPWALWGHSGGATWAFQMSKKYPEKILGVVLKSICEADPGFDPALLQIPTLLATGPLDLGQCQPTTTQIFLSYRSAGAAWAFVDEPEGSHDSAELRLLAIPYLDSVIAARLQQTPAEALRPIDQQLGFLGNNSTRLVAEARNYHADVSSSSWLPGQQAAEAWRQFVTAGSVEDSSPPDRAPSQVKAVLQGSNLLLSWLSDADLESGIRTFNVYRDGKVAQVVQHFDQPFQTGNYGDEPDPIEPRMSAIDPMPGGRYRVEMVNGSGLVSPLSDEVPITPE